MKKLMMFAAAMTIVGGAYASAPGSEASPCDTPVWDFVMKGKTANGIEKGYKAVYAISYKGAIVGNLTQVPVAGTGGTSVQTKTIIEVNGAVTTNAVVYTPGADLIASGSETNGAAGLIAVTTNAPIKTVSYTTNGVPGVTSAPVPAVKNTWVMYSEETVITESIDYTNAVPFAGNETTLNEVRTVLSTTVPYRLMIVDETVTTPADLSENCCLDTFTVFLYDRVDKTLIPFENQEVIKMSVFGSGLNKPMKPGGRATLESDVMWKLEDGDLEIDLQFVGFGKAKYRVSKGGSIGTICDPIEVDPCVPSFDWPNWSGWFTGFFGPETADSHDLNCDSCVAVAGGTWSAKLNKKLSAAADPEAAIYRKFKVSYIFDEF